MQWLSLDRVVNGNIIARLYSYQVRQWHYYYFFFRRSAGCYKTPEVGSVRIGWLWWVGGANCWYARLGKRVSHCNLPTDRPTDLTRAWRVGLYGKYDCRGGGMVFRAEGLGASNWAGRLLWHLRCFGRTGLSHAEHVWPVLHSQKNSEIT